MAVRHLLRSDALSAPLARLAPRWRLWLDAPRDGATNMAVDLALLEAARAGPVATIRLYAWATPTLSFGRNERAAGRYDRATLEGDGIGVVRRPTGGRALLHHREVTYCVVAPLTDATPAEAYRAINALLAAALGRLGVTVSPATRTARALRPDGAACFAEPAPGELVIGGAKLVGSAQLIEHGALLQHGSILLEDDQSRIVSLRTGATTSGATGGATGPGLAPVATLAAELGRPVDPAEVTTAIADELSDGVTSVRVAESDMGLSASVAAHRVRFTDPDWTWRR